MSALLHALGIQWSVLLAQIINFSILIVILGRYVYKPILKVIDDRREMIRRSVDQAREIAHHKEKIEQESTVILRKADEKAGKLLEQAKADAEALRTESEKAAHAHAEQILAKGRQQLEFERKKIAHELQDKLAHAIVQSAEKILRREFSKEDQHAFEAELKSNIPSLIA